MSDTTHMKTLFRVLYPNGRMNSSAADWPDDPTPAMIDRVVRAYLGGAQSEHVHVQYEGETVSMYITSQAHLRLHSPRAPLPLNRQATAVYRHHWMVRYPKTDPTTLPGICGVAVLFDRALPA